MFSLDDITNEKIKIIIAIGHIFEIIHTEC